MKEKKSRAGVIIIANLLCGICFPKIRKGQKFNFEIVSAFSGYTSAGFRGFYIHDGLLKIPKEETTLKREEAPASTGSSSSLNHVDERNVLKRNLCLCSFLGSIIFVLSAVLCGCNGTGRFSEKKYTPVYVYLSTTPYVGESSMSDFVDYPSDLVRLGLRGAVKEVKTTSAAEMVQKFNEDGNLTSQGLWFDSSHRFGDEYKREYDDQGRLAKLYNARNKWKAEVYAYDEWNRLIECRADDYTRTYQYTGEDRSCYVINTECKKESEVASYFFSGICDNKKFVFDTYDKPEGYRRMDGKTRMHFQTECPMTELCKRFTKIYYPDSRYYKNKIDSIVNTYNVSYNDKEDMEQYLIHSVEYPSGKTWDCQIDYSYEYDEHDNWVVLKLYCSELRKLLGDFIIIQKDAEGKTYTEDRRVISYYETEVGNGENHKEQKTK